MFMIQAVHNYYRTEFDLHDFADFLFWVTIDLCSLFGLPSIPLIGSIGFTWFKNVASSRIFVAE